jgi:hypothetical protein
MIWLIHFDAEHPGAISAALGSGPKRSSRAIIDYMKQRMSTMAPGDSAALIEAMSSELSIVVGQP